MSKQILNSENFINNSVPITKSYLKDFFSNSYKKYKISSISFEEYYRNLKTLIEVMDSKDYRFTSNAMEEVLENRDRVEKLILTKLLFNVKTYGPEIKIFDNDKLAPKEKEYFENHDGLMSLETLKRKFPKLDQIRSNKKSKPAYVRDNAKLQKKYLQDIVNEFFFNTKELPGDFFNIVKCTGINIGTFTKEFILDTEQSLENKLKWFKEVASELDIFDNKDLLYFALTHIETFNELLQTQQGNLKSIDFLESPQNKEKWNDLLLNENAQDKFFKNSLESLYTKLVEYLIFYKHPSNSYKALSGLDLLLTNNVTHKEIKDLLSLLSVPLIPKKSLQIFSDLADSTDLSRLPEIKIKGLHTIYNQEGYEDIYPNQLNNKHGSYFINGVAIKLNEDVPIGYNIHIPSGPIKATVVTVYGGGAGAFHCIDNLSKFEEKLLTEGVAIITLNLLDLLQDNFHNQCTTSKELADKLHASINKFCITLKTSPQIFVSDPVSLAKLQKLAEQPLYLSGSSFGGELTIKHAQLYPNTFKGYISLDGDLSFLQSKLSDFIFPGALPKPGLIEGAEEASLWLSPEYGIEKIQDPILVVQNLDDNNVNAKVGLYFYKKASKQIGNLANILLVSKGSMSEYDDKGHLIPNNTGEFLHMFKGVKKFIDNPHNPLMAKASALQAFQGDIYSNKNYISATVEEKFISEAYRVFKNQEDYNTSSIIKNWDNTYLPLYHAVYYLSQLQNSPDLIDLEIKWLKTIDQKLIDKAVIKSITTSFNELKDFIKDYVNEEFDLNKLNVKIGDLPNLESIRENYKTLLFSKYTQNNVKLHMLKQLYIALANDQTIFEHVNNYVDTNYNLVKDSDQVKGVFLSLIAQEEGLVTDLMLSAQDVDSSIIGESLVFPFNN